MYRRFRRDFAREEGEGRLAAFKRTVARAHGLNREQGVDCRDLFDDPNCVFGIGKFADRLPEELARTSAGFRRGPSAAGAPVLAADEEGPLPERLDWRAEGAVTQVRDQGECGGCWAYSAVEAIESAVWMKTKRLGNLSTQQVLSCDTGDHGCKGGDPTRAYDYVKSAGGIDSAEDYPETSPRTGATGKCSWDRKAAARVSGFEWAVPPCDDGCTQQSEEALARALAKRGPLSVCVNIEGWHDYKRGVFSRFCEGGAFALSHCVLLVGYDLQEKYWLVRNQWGRDWGEEGYMRLAMFQRNLCGIADHATAATVAADELLV